MKIIKKKLAGLTQKHWRIVTLLYTGLLVAASINPWLRPMSNNSLLSPDILMHLVAYGLLSVLLWHSFKPRQGRSSGWLWVMISIGVSAAIGISLELLQSFSIIGRAMSFQDAVANTLGATLGALICLMASNILKSGKGNTGI